MSITTSQPSDDDLSLERASELFEQQAAVGSRSQQSVGTYMNGVNALLRWADEIGLTTVSDLTKMNVGGFNQWLSNVDGWSSSYKQSITTGVRQFLKFLEERDMIQRSTHELVRSYHVPKSERQSDNEVRVERLDAIIRHMEREYPHHRDTIIFKIISSTAMRTCAVHSLDVGDVQLDAQGRPEIQVRNRPKEGTNLKEGDDHERNVPITTEIWDSLNAYVKNHRHDVTDDHGRLPLITSWKGRLSKSGIQDVCYKWTCPMSIGDTDGCSCEEKPSARRAYKCEASEGPHAIRAAAITRWFNHGKSADDISIVAAADGELLKRHYDKGSMADKADRARSLLDVL